MRATRLLPMGANSFQIHMNPDRSRELQGEVCGRGFTEPTPFTGLSGLIVMLENQMDLEPEEFPSKAAPASFAPTVELEVLFRQNYSWQGKIRWLECQREASFRSVLELIIQLEMMFAE